MDEFDQQYTVFRNLHAFSEIPGFDDFFSTQNTGHWRIAGMICGYVNKLSEELITPDELIADNGDCTMNCVRGKYTGGKHNGRS